MGWPRIYIPRTIGLFGFNNFFKSAAICCIINGCERAAFVYNKDYRGPFDLPLNYEKFPNIVSENNGENYYICPEAFDFLRAPAYRAYVLTTQKKTFLPIDFERELRDLENYVLYLGNDKYLRWVRASNGIDYSGIREFNMWSDFYKRTGVFPQFYEILKEDCDFDCYNPRNKRLFEERWLKEDEHFLGSGSLEKISKRDNILLQEQSASP